MDYKAIDWYLKALDRLMREQTENYSRLDRACYMRNRASELMRFFKDRNRDAYFRACYMYGWFKSKFWLAEQDVKLVDRLMNDYKVELEKLGEQW